MWFVNTHFTADASDYSHINTTVVFSTSDDTEKEVAINITADTEVEGEETFRCILRVERSVISISRPMATITIRDDNTVIVSSMNGKYPLTKHSVL